jgi:transposase-like protein
MPPKRGQPHTPNVAQYRVEARRAEVARLYLEGGHTHKQLATQFGVCPQRIQVDLAVIKQRWEAQSLESLVAKKAELDAALAQIITAAWQGWHRSCTEEETTVTEATEGGEIIDLKTGQRHTPAPTRKARVQKRGQAGNPAFLTTILEALEKRAKLFGLHAPLKVDLNLDDLSDEQLIALEKGLPVDMVLAMVPAANNPTTYELAAEGGPADAS